MQFYLRHFTVFWEQLSEGYSAGGVGKGPNHVEARSSLFDKPPSVCLVLLATSGLTYAGSIFDISKHRILYRGMVVSEQVVNVHLVTAGQFWKSFTE